MPKLDTSAFPLLGKTTNSHFYEIEKNIIAGVMDPGARDSRETARENQGYYHDYFREHGSGMLIYCLDRITDQSSAARHVYRDESDPTLIYCVGLLVGSMLSRAVGTFYLGLGRPPEIPVKVSGSLDTVLDWGKPICDERRGRES